MVLSLAFILAFVGSAIVLIVGILIFSEVSEAMALTLPILFDDGDWFAREHCKATACSTAPLESIMLFDVDSGGAVVFTVITTQSSTDAWFGRVFDRSELANKEITIRTSQGLALNSNMRGVIWDGDFDPVFLYPFFLDVDPRCFDCFPTDKEIRATGSLGTQAKVTLWNNPIGIGTFIQVSNVTLSAFDSPTGKATLMIQNTDFLGNGNLQNTIHEINIQDKGQYLFEPDPADPNWNGSVETVIREDPVGGCSDPNHVLCTDSLSFFTSRPPNVNTESELSAHDSFNQASNVAFTVIGILPVALFFALFSIFSGRTE